MGWRVRAASAHVAIALTLSACHAYDADLLGGSNAIRVPPARPKGADSPKEQSVFFAMRDLIIDQSKGLWGTITYDIDGRNTTVDDNFNVECMQPDKTVKPEVDGPRGVDNAVGHRIAPLFLVLYPTAEADARSSLEVGTAAPLLEIRGWNGEDNDPKVDMRMSASVFATPGNPDGSKPDVVLPNGRVNYDVPGGDPPYPIWDGNDYWWAGDDNFIGGDPELPKIHDDNAYVADRTLVASIPDRATFTLSGPVKSMKIQMTDGGFTGRISEDGTRLENGVVFGRWAIYDFLETMEGVGYCKGTVEHDIFSTLLSQTADVRSDPGTAVPGSICDGLSWAFGITGYVAHFAGVTPTWGQPNPCAASE